MRGLSEAQVRHGIDRARVECKWPPSISEFIDLCLDIPSLGEFIVEQDFTTQLMSIAMIVGKVTAWDLNQMSSGELNWWKRDVYPLVVEKMRKIKLGV